MITRNTGSKILRVETDSASSKRTTKINQRSSSRCSADAGIGKHMVSLEDTLMNPETPSTSWVTPSTLEWAHTFSILSKEERSITAASQRKERLFTRSTSTASSDNSVMSPLGFTKDSTSQTARQSLLRAMKWNTNSITRWARK